MVQGVLLCIYVVVDACMNELHIICTGCEDAMIGSSGAARLSGEGRRRGSDDTTNEKKRKKEANETGARASLLSLMFYSLVEAFLLYNSASFFLFL